MTKKLVFAGCFAACAGLAVAQQSLDQELVPSDGVLVPAGEANQTPPRNHNRDLQSLHVVWDNGAPDYDARPFDDPYLDPTGVVWDNGDPTYTNGNELTAFIEACDFNLAAGATISAMDFSAFDFNGGNFPNFDGTVSWEIRNNSAGTPGSIVDSGVGVNVNRTFDQVNGSGWAFYDWSMDLDNPVTLGPGTYWITLKLNVSCATRWDYYWSLAPDNGTLGRYYDAGCVGTWTASATNESAFVLYSPDGGGDCIDFDDLNAPCIFADTVALTTEYSGLGVTFSGPAANDGGGVLDQCGGFGVSARSGTAFLAFNSGCSGCYSNGGTPNEPETIRFSSPVTSVSMWISGGSTSNNIRVTAWDAGGNNVDADSITAPVGTWAEATVSAPGIVRVVIDDTQNEVFVIDDLCWESGPSDCITLEVANLVAGQTATWTVSNLPPGVRAAVVWGLAPGTTVVNGTFGYCATFDINGVGQNRLIGQPAANGSGIATVSKRVPGNVSGLNVLMQAAQQGTCPDECMSNLLDEVIG